jgi:polynucleotide 5'-kinase involved in rRNA processing
VPKTLLIGHPETSWREWLKDNRGGCDLLCLDPADPVQGVPGRICMFRGSRPVYARFFGSLDPLRYPDVLLAALVEGMAASESDLIVQSFGYKPSPLARRLVALIAQMVRAETILVADNAEIDLNGFPVGPQTVSIEKAFPRMVQDAQRKAQWMKLIEQCVPHTVDLSRVTIEGARFGAGQAMTVDEQSRVGLKEALYVERCGTSLFVIGEADIDEAVVSRALDLTHATRVFFARPEDFADLYCSFARQSGEDFGLGMIQSIDWTRRTAQILCDAVPPAPVRILRLGALRVTAKGQELGELRPWQV